MIKIQLLRILIASVISLIIFAGLIITLASYKFLKSEGLKIIYFKDDNNNLLPTKILWE